MCRRQRGHGLRVHHRHRRLLSDGAAARPPRAAAGGARRDADRGDLARPAVRHARHERRRADEPGARSGRHRAVGFALPARGPAAVARRRRRADEHSRLHHGGRLAAPRCRHAGARDGGRARGGLSRREDQGRQAAPGRRRGAAAGGARRGGRRLRADGGREPVLHARRGAAARAALRGARHRVVRGAAAGGRPCGPCGARGAGRAADRGGRVAVFDRPVRRLRARACLPRGAGRRGARGRDHAVAEGGSPGRGLQPRRGTAFPDGAARVAVRRGAERGVARIHPAARRHRRSRVRIEDGRATPPETPGLGIEWDRDAVAARAKARFDISRKDIA